MLYFHNNNFSSSQSFDSLEQECKIDKKSGENFFNNLKKRNFDCCIKYIGDNRAFLFLQDAHGKTAIHRLVYQYCSSDVKHNPILTVIKKLLDIDWKLMNMRDKFMQTPLYLAFLTRDKVNRINDIVQLFTSYAIDNSVALDLHIKNHKDLLETVLHIATREGSTDAINFILKYDNSTIFSINKFESTALHYAAFYGHEEIVRLFLLHIKCNKTLLDAQDKCGYTALHSAAARNRIEIVQCLITNGADCDILNKQKKIYLDLLPINSNVR